MAEQRLQKYLSQAGVASRRKAEEVILAGRVRVNGAVVKELGSKVEPGRDVVEVDGRRVRTAATVWLALNKPRGYVTTRDDPEGRATVYELVPPEYHGLFYVGRLDYESEGLILLTNEGEVANRLMHPRYGTERVYEVELGEYVSPAALRQLRTGVQLEDGPARVEAAVRMKAPPGRTRLRLTLLEGRNREVRRLFRALGQRVERLVRVSYGPVRLGNLAAGSWRRLTANEMLSLSAAGRDGVAGARER
ncbi:MAG TPA: pseudouridine synthase [Longimicrobiales bacterium]